MTSTTALVNGRVLLDEGFRDDVAVLLSAGRVQAVVEAGDARVRDAARVDLAGGSLLPGFIDAQVNGGGGVLLNNTPTVEGIRAIVIDKDRKPVWRHAEIAAVPPELIDMMQSEAEGGDLALTNWEDRP